MKRPIGLILSTIALGFIALSQLGMAALMTATGFIGRSGIRSSRPGAPALPPSFLFYFSIAVAFGAALLATWAILTLVGLLRLINAARISVLVIGGCLAGFGGLSFLTSIAAMFIHLPAPSNQSAHLQPIIFGVVGFFCALIAGVGVWWLIYFTRASVSALFVRPAFAAYGYDPTLPALPLQKPGRFSNVPVLIVILACLLLVSAPSCAILALTPFPAFFFGVIFSGFASHIVYLTMAIFTALIGYGLLRLDSRARIATIFVLCLGPINSVSLLLPSGHAQFNLYNQKVMEMFRFPGVPPTPMPDFGYSYVVMSSVLVVIFNAALFWILYRYRGDFQRTPPPPALG